MGERLAVVLKGGYLVERLGRYARRGGGADGGVRRLAAIGFEEKDERTSTSIATGMTRMLSASLLMGGGQCAPAPLIDSTMMKARPVMSDPMAAAFRSATGSFRARAQQFSSTLQRALPIVSAALTTSHMVRRVQVPSSCFNKTSNVTPATTTLYNNGMQVPRRRQAACLGNSGAQQGWCTLRRKDTLQLHGCKMACHC